jgi:hypothetical protein
MSLARTIGAGAVVRKQSGGGGAATSQNQGGGPALQGLISTTNMAINGAMAAHIRTRAGGGNTRNWVFCTNQLGGVGRRWGQAAGPGNRGGVHAGCAAKARASRLAFPLRADQATGWGSPPVFRANPVLGAGPPDPQPPTTITVAGAGYTGTPDPALLKQFFALNQTYNAWGWASAASMACTSFWAPLDPGTGEMPTSWLTKKGEHFPYIYLEETGWPVCPRPGLESWCWRGIWGLYPANSALSSPFYQMTCATLSSHGGHGGLCGAVVPPVNYDINCARCPGVDICAGWHAVFPYNSDTASLPAFTSI